MTPRELDWRSIRPKLRFIRELLDELVSYGEIDESRLRADHMLQLAVERILTQIVEYAFKINTHVTVARLRQASDSYRGSFSLAAKAGLIDPDLASALIPSAGLRNVLIHAYEDVDPQKVLAAIPLAPVQYGAYVEQVARWVGEQEKAEVQNRSGGR
jgi:uncharacterized protein YutE (UPF0331/DUF86 family)